MHSESIIIILLLGILFLISAYELVRFSLLIKRSQRLIDTSGQFQRVLPRATSRIVVAGDSAAVGVGATDLHSTISGRLAKQFPHATVETIAKSGKRIRDMLEEPLPEGPMDFLLISIGGNDIVHFTPISDIAVSLRTLIESAKPKARHIIFVHGGNVGACLAFPYFMRVVYDIRTLRVRDVYLNVTKEAGVGYVDMYTRRDVFPYRVGDKSTFAPDLFHPSDTGYAIWHDLILKELHRISSAEEIERLYGIV